LFRDDFVELEEQVLLVGELGFDVHEAIFRHGNLLGCLTVYLIRGRARGPTPANK
jgi:hypothetical protein